MDRFHGLGFRRLRRGAFQWRTVSGIDARLFSFRLRASQFVLKSQTRNQYFIVLCGRAPYRDRLTRRLRDVRATEHVCTVHLVIDKRQDLIVAAVYF